MSKKEQQAPEFTKHEVENPYDWSEWVCPDPKSYLMKCCDCGLVHEAQFRVAKYKPAPSDECEVVSDPDLQAQFRMRRSEQWSPEDTAHRAGGLPMAEQPAQQQEPIAWIERDMQCDDFDPDSVTCQKPDIAADGWEWVPLYITTPRKPWVGLTEKEKRDARNSVSYSPLAMTMGEWTEAVQDATEAKLREKNNG